MTELGQLSLWVALLMAVWGAALSWAGAATDRDAIVASGARGLYASALFVALASAGLAWALLAGDFSVRYVASFTSASLPVAYRLSAFWAGRAGAVLLAALALSVCVAIVLAATRRRERVRAPWLATALGVALALVLSVAAMDAAPFTRLEVVPADGRGLDPALQNPGVAMLRPLTYLGGATAGVAFALAVAGFATRRGDVAWRSGVRTWLLGAWCALGACVLLALRVGYVESGAGGYWLWRTDGVRNASSGFGVAAALAVAVGVLIAGDRLGRTGAAVRPPRGRWATLAAGLALVALGFAGTVFRSEQVVALADGESWHGADPLGRAWTLTSQGASRIERPHYFLTSVAFVPTRSGVRERFLTTERREFYGRDGRAQFPPYVRSGLRASLLEDVSVRLVSLSAGRVVVRVGFVPLVTWVWIGGAVALVGGAIVLSGSRREPGT